MNHQSVFKTTESRDKIRRAYNEILNRFPFGQSYVDTTYGKTFILTAGADGNPPILLLHGSCSNSAFWFPEMMALSQNHSVFAVDIIGEAGNSEDRRPELTSDDYAFWLGEVLDALWLRKAIIIGNSLGGWLALKYAVAFPERVSKLILIAASGLSQKNSAFLDKAISDQKENRTITMDASGYGGAALPQEVLDFMNLILRGYNPITEQLPVFTDEQLQRLTMPVLFIGGEKDVIVNTKGAAQRLSRRLPNAEVRLLDNVGHMVMNTPEFIIPFLMKKDPV